METDFDASLYVLGSLCKRGHDWNGTGRSLRYVKVRSCVACTHEKNKAYERNPGRRRPPVIHPEHPDFDTAIYRLGAMCPRGHQYQNTGGSLRYAKTSPHCVECKKAKNRPARKSPVVTTPQPENPDFDPLVFFLGTLCRNGHDHGDGRSLRYLKHRNTCVECARPRLRDAAKRRMAAETPESRERRITAQNEASKQWRKKNAEYIKKRDLARYHALTPAEKFKANRRRRYFRDPAVRKATIRKNTAMNRIRLNTIPGYREKTREVERIAKAKRLQECPWLRIASSVRTALRDVLHRRRLGKKGGRSWQRMVGYTVADLRAHLEKQFEPWMTWENYGKEWHIDHIIPVSAFAFTGPDDPNIKRAWALSNLRPLETIANIRKSNRLILRA